MKLEVSLTPSPPLFSFTPTWCAGGVYNRGRESGEEPPPAAGGYRPTRDHPPDRSRRRTRKGEALVYTDYRCAAR